MKPKSDKNKTHMTLGEKRTLNAQLKKLAASWALAERDDVLARHALGVEVNALKREYGITFADQALKLGKSKTQISSHGQIASDWSRGALRSLLKRANGKLTWSHLVEISPASIDAAAKKKWVNAIIEKGLSLEDLREQLNPDAAPQGVNPAHSADSTAGHADAAGGAEENPDTGKTDSDANFGGGSPDEASGSSGDANGHVLGAARITPLRHWSKEFSTLAGQAELINHQVFIPLEKTNYDELEKEPLKDLLEELSATKKANEDLERVCHANIERLNAVIVSVQSAHAKRGGDVGIDDDESSLRLLPSGTTATPALPPHMLPAAPVQPLGKRKGS